MMKTPLLAAAALASAVLVVATVAGCSSNKTSTSSSSPTTSPSPTSASRGTAEAPSSSKPSDSTDYTALLLKASDIGGSEPWTADPPKLNPGGQAGAEGLYKNKSGTRAVDIQIQVWNDAAQAQQALQGGKSALPGVVTGTPQDADVGDGGTIVSGTKPDGSRAITVLLFTQGKAFVDMTVASLPDDPAPPANVIDLGKQQASNIESGLPA